jgi:hypothetical protein
VFGVFYFGASDFVFGFVIRNSSARIEERLLMRRIRLHGLLIVSAIIGTSTAARADLVVYYDFNDASNALVANDVSGNGNVGDINVATYSADAGGHSGSAGDRALDLGAFDNGANVVIPSAGSGAFDSLTLNDTATVSLWINGGSEQPAPQWMFNAGPGRQLGSHTPWSDSNIYFDVAGCCGANQRISQNEPDASKYSDGWNHYAYVKDGGTTAVYQNGALFVASAPGVIDPLGAITEFYVGSGEPGDQRSYNGLIDDFAVWDIALSADRIADIAGGGPVIPEPSTLATASLGLLSLIASVRRRRR